LRGNVEVHGQTGRHGSKLGLQQLRQGLGIAADGKSEAQSDAYASFAQLHVVNHAGRSERLAQEWIDMILQGGAYLVQAWIVHDTIMAAKGAGL
jgi:hypothetical protein